MEITTTGRNIEIAYADGNTKTIRGNMVSDFSVKGGNLIFRYVKENEMLRVPYSTITKYNGSATIPAIGDLYDALVTVISY